MGDEKKLQQEDFFSLLEKDQKIEDPFAMDEILFRDKSGNLKVLKGGQVLDYDKKVDKSSITDKPAQVQPAAKTATEAAVKTTLPKPAPPPPIGKALKLDKEVNSIISKAGLTFSEPGMEKRFKNIINLRLKEVRDQIQTREVLLSSPLIGGMGLDSEQVDKILAIINQESQNLDDRLRDEVSGQPFSDLKAEAQRILSEPIKEPPKMVFKNDKPQDLKPEPVKPEVEKKPEDLTPQVPSPPSSIPRPVTSSDSGKPKIEDIKFQPRLTGPVEEIRSMTLVDFRRLASTPQEAVDKILEKINLLEEESFTKKTNAIKAWKENEVSRLYLELGDQSMEERKPISDIIKERQQANKPTLTEEELEIIIGLNQKLRF